MLAIVSLVIPDGLQGRSGTQGNRVAPTPGYRLSASLRRG